MKCLFSIQVVKVILLVFINDDSTPDCYIFREKKTNEHFTSKNICYVIINCVCAFASSVGTFNCNVSNFTFLAVI